MITKQNMSNKGRLQKHKVMICTAKMGNKMTHKQTNKSTVGDQTSSKTWQNELGKT
jgi:hypothetical protein